VTKGKICFRVVSFCSRADCLAAKLTFDSAVRISLKFERFSSNVALEEFDLRSPRASPLIKPRFTPGGQHEVTCVY
jgi:hypothetical protein